MFDSNGRKCFITLQNFYQILIILEIFFIITVIHFKYHFNYFFVYGPIMGCTHKIHQ